MTPNADHVGELLEGQLAVLEGIARELPLPHTLEAIVRLVERQANDMLCSVLLLDRAEGVLRDGAGPSLPPSYRRAIDGLAIGPTAGSCGTAAYSGQAVEVSDIATDPRWDGYRELALPFGLRACWSTPICDAAGEVLGTFAMYHREARAPNADERRWVAAATHLASIAIDRARARAALEASEARYRLLVDTAEEGVWVVDHRQITTFVNRRIGEMLGRAPSEIIGRPPDDFIDPVSRPVLERAIAERRQGHSGQQEIALRRRDGTTLWVLAHATPMLGPEGQLIGSFAMVSDISARRRVEAALRQSEAELRATFDHAGIGMALLGSDMRPRRLNASCARFLGYTREELLGKSVADVTHPADKARSVELYLELLSGKRTFFQQEKRYLRKDGAVVWGNVTATLVVPPDGGDPHDEPRERLLLALIEDIDVKKRLESQVLRAQRMDSLARLASGIAHDFNNILTAIDGYARVALDELEPASNAAYAVGEIGRAAGRASDLVRRILTFSRDVEPQRMVQPLGPIVSEVASLLRPTLPKKIALAVELADDAPPVRADATQVHQIVMNLATNAAHAMPDGGALGIRLERVVLASPISADIGPGTYARLAVSDTGHGIDEATFERLFEPFFTTKAPGQGTGLGLPMVHGIARSHGGGVMVRSEVGHGSTFEVWLPAAQEAPVVAPPSPGVGPLGRGERVLFVDDEPAIVKLASRELQRVGFQVVPFQDPSAALAAFQAAPETFDVVVSDISMPQLSGVDLARAVRRLRADLPIVLISGRPVVARQRGREAPARGGLPAEAERAEAAGRGHPQAAAGGHGAGLKRALAAPSRTPEGGRAATGGRRARSGGGPPALRGAAHGLYAWKLGVGSKETSVTTSIATIEEFLTHKRLALVGASHNPTDFSRAVMRELVSHGYDIVPVNRKRADGDRHDLIGERPSYSHVTDIPAPVEGAIVMVPASEARAVVEDCVRAGVGRVWLHRGAGQGACSPEALAVAKAEGLAVVEGECPLMFVCHGGVHAMHGAVRRLTGAYPLGGVATAPRWAVLLLATLQLVVALGALVAGALMVGDPSGAALGMNTAMLSPSPFGSFLVPGLVLFMVNGVGQAAAGVATLRRQRRAWLYAAMLGVFLVLWIAFESLWLGPTSWLQPVIAVIGLGQLGLGLYGVRRTRRS
ncbi:MAG: PAS domain S-box protein [Myxococcota bacterium]